jgi:hypothetical protein
MSPPDAPLLADALAVITADLEGYIQRRAAELAAPMVAEAEERAAEKAGEAQAATRQQEDLVKELRRHLDAKERQIARWREVATKEAGDIILRCDEVREGDRLLENGGLMTVLKVSAWVDHDTPLVGFSVQAEDGRKWHVDSQPDALVAVRREVKSGSEGDKGDG